MQAFRYCHRHGLAATLQMRMLPAVMRLTAERLGNTLEADLETQQLLPETLWAEVRLGTSQQLLMEELRTLPCVLLLLRKSVDEAAAVGDPRSVEMQAILRLLYSRTFALLCEESFYCEQRRCFVPLWRVESNDDLLRAARLSVLHGQNVVRLQLWPEAETADMQQQKLHDHVPGSHRPAHSKAIAVAQLGAPEMVLFLSAAELQLRAMLGGPTMPTSRLLAFAASLVSLYARECRADVLPAWSPSSEGWRTFFILDERDSLHVRVEILARANFNTFLRVLPTFLLRHSAVDQLLGLRAWLEQVGITADEWREVARPFMLDERPPSDTQSRFDEFERYLSHAVVNGMHSFDEIEAHLTDYLHLHAAVTRESRPYDFNSPTRREHGRPQRAPARPPRAVAAQPLR